MKKKIDITKENRDLFYNRGKKLWFEQVSENLYTINTDLDYLLEHVRISYDELPENATEYDSMFTDQHGRTHKCKNHSFDPPGGPYIAVDNYKIDGNLVKRIYNKDNQILFETY